MEYTKQLILSCLLNICQKLSPDGSKIPKGTRFAGSEGAGLPTLSMKAHTTRDSSFLTLQIFLMRRSLTWS